MNFAKATNFLESLNDAGIPGADLAIYIRRSLVTKSMLLPA